MTEDAESILKVEWPTHSRGDLYGATALLEMEHALMILIKAQSKYPPVKLHVEEMDLEWFFTRKPWH